MLENIHPQINKNKVNIIILSNFKNLIFLEVEQIVNKVKILMKVKKVKKV